ncbi:MAG: 5'-deoxyadenosine deaminase [Calditrichales bacterium]|nr:5'-deoxyadenosine deaminase [Calditrichales bacterium]
MMNKKILIKNPLIVTMNPKMDVLQGDILVEGNQIVQIAENISSEYDELFDAQAFIAVPGLIQSHVHLCQTLFRNFADDLTLLDWLTKKIWPFESRHTPETLRLSARLGIAELIKSGVTTIMDMGAVHHQDVIFEELASSGMRAIAGKTMMDYGQLPEGLKENTQDSISESVRLLEKWHNYDNGRIKYAFSPRFALCCSDDLLREAGNLAKKYNVIFHTHASESKVEIQLVRERFGVRNIMLFEKLGIADENLCLAHCIWTDNEEKALLKEKNIKTLHCPSANLKLGSGIAPIPEYLESGITVSIGSDGAPCNNNLDIFQEMRLAALIQKPFYGPQAMSAQDTFKLATTNGSKALGLENEIGSIEIDKIADISFIKNNQVHSVPYENVYSKLVYSTQASDVDSVMINGKWVLKNRELSSLNETEIVQSVQKAIVRF